MLFVDRLSLTLDRDKLIFSDISFTLRQGETLLLSGRNGSGKSLLLKTLKGLIQPTSGKIEMEGEDVSKAKKKRLSFCGLVFQDTDMQIVGQSVEKDLLFGLHNLSVDEQECRRRIDEVARISGITHLLERRPMLLSGGEKRRVALAGVMVMHPKMIFLDEPFANLDYPGIMQVLESIVSLQQSGATLIIATHEVEKVAAHCDSCLILESGRVALSGTMNEVLPLAGPYGIRVPRSRNGMVPIEELSWLR